MKYTLLVLLVTTFSAFSQVERVEPPFWWSGMHNPDLQLMLYGDNLSKATVTIEGEKVELRKVTTVESPNYLFVDIRELPEAKAQTISLTLTFPDGSSESIPYEYRQRRPGSAMREGFNTKDVLYLITPDRFANGNQQNDEIKGMREPMNRDFKGGRHGGDIKGILDNLDYIDDMGFTAIWLNPLLENDMEKYSYHGYSTTDFYKVDARFGSNEDYLKLSQESKERGIGMIMDMIVNHCGSEHWWMKDLPMSDWINNYPGDYKQTSHRKTTIQDPYVSQIDLEDFTDGWFVPTMPDLNQRNEFMGTYLIQNSIWWVEYADLEGIRMDTYPYPDKDYMTEWTCAVMNEYPNFNIVGEEWNIDPAIVSFWVRGKENPNGYTSCLPSAMDFPMQSNIAKAFNDKEENYSGLVSLYEIVAKDFLYPDPYNLVTFPDNHDMSRIFVQLNENVAYLKQAMAYVLTMRGVPQIYYGTEILMKHPGSDHGDIRADFPGGWKEDKVNAFTGKRLNEEQKEVQEYVKKITNWRKTATAIHDGKLIHYNPKDGVYVYFRYTKDKTVMVVLNKNTEPAALSLDRFYEVLGNKPISGTEIITGKPIESASSLELVPLEPMIIEISE